MSTRAVDLRVGELRVEQLGDAVASDAPTPGGGAVAGTVAALAAALAAMAGRYAVRREPDSAVFPRLTAESDRLRARALGLADADAVAYGRYVRASRAPLDADASRVAIREALDAAADVPAELATLAADVAEIGARLAVEGNPRLRTDARSAALIASAAAASAALLVQENLGDRPLDERIAGARDQARRAEAAVRRALAATTPVAQGVAG